MPFRAWFLSTALHGSVLLLLGLLIRHIVKQTEPKGVAINAVGQPAEPLNDAPIGTPTNLHPGVGSTDVESAPLGDSLGLSLEDVPARLTLSGRTASAPGIDAVYSSDANTNLPQGDGGGFALGTGKGRGGGLGGRTPGRRGQLAKSGGGTAKSEEAVERGLKWLLAHQHEDGGWRFNFDGAPCENLCRNPGAEKSTTGATALALLPFYGAGYTHKEGPYAEQVNHGLYYLCGRMLVTPQGGDLQEGTMYAQGISTIVLCEAYAMSKDEKLRPFAQNAAQFYFVRTGQTKRRLALFSRPGRRYDSDRLATNGAEKRSDGRTGSSLAGVSLGRQISRQRGNRERRCLWLSSSGRGPRDNLSRPVMPHVSRLEPSTAGTDDGCHQLDKLGPSPTNLYYDYYATQVLFHYGGSGWDGWNKKLHEYLISTQSKEGHENGSWYFVDSHGDKGGRLYNTAMAILTLEVYYRYLPLYSNRAVEDGF